MNFILLSTAFCVLGIEAREFPTLRVERNITFLGEVIQRSVPLRILPLGDSITNGSGSSDHNGWRDLFVELATQGGPLQMIGSQEGQGNIPNGNNKHDGWDGYTISAIAEKANNALEAKPNLVLLLAGTNNMHNASQASAAPAEMRALIHKVLTLSHFRTLLIDSIDILRKPKGSGSHRHHSCLHMARSAAT
jgi:hypothetical protein